MSEGKSISTTGNFEHLHVTANGIAFHVAAAGERDAPPILFLHGFPEGWMSWRAVMAALREYRVYAPDLRGYPGTSRTQQGYDVFTLTDDIKELIGALGLEKPAIVAHDWGGALAWIFAHRYSYLIRHLIVVNCTHPKTLVRAVLELQHGQTFRFPYVLFFQIPWFPEFFLTTTLGRKLLKWSCMALEGNPGALDSAALDELISRFQKPDDIRGPIDYYRQLVRMQFMPERRATLDAIYQTPISIPAALVWGDKDLILVEAVARESHLDAGCAVDFRVLSGTGHFVELEAPERLVSEIRRALS
jgi:pimeloyl-ACP methyl ester carboxylesterase